MQLDNTPVSQNIEDRRGQSGGGMRMGGGGLGIGAILIVFAISYFTGINPQILMQGAEIVAGNGGDRPDEDRPANDRTGR